MQLCSWKQPSQLECGQVAWFPPLALGFGFVDMSSEIGPSPAANSSVVAPWNHPGLSPNPSSSLLPPVGCFSSGARLGCSSSGGLDQWFSQTDSSGNCDTRKWRGVDSGLIIFPTEIYI